MSHQMFCLKVHLLSAVNAHDLESSTNRFSTSLPLSLPLYCPVAHLSCLQNSCSDELGDWSKPSELEAVPKQTFCDA